MITRRQLLDFGISAKAIKHRLSAGRLHPIWPGVYAAGRPQLTLHGRWMAAVLACGPHAALSHEPAAMLLGILQVRSSVIEVSVPRHVARRPRGVVVHRRATLDVSRRHGIPVTTPIATLVDIAPRLSHRKLEAAVNEADKLDLVDPERLRQALRRLPRRPGVKKLRDLLDHRTFTLTDSDLERRFIPLAVSAGLPKPQTGEEVNGFQVDFYWRDLGLVVETDGLRYHRTPAQQAKDRIRDQAHTAAGLTPLRFTRAQVRFDPDHVRATLATVANRLRRARPPAAPRRGRRTPAS